MFQYINIYSAETVFGKVDKSRENTKTLNKKRLSRGCPTQLNYTKFSRQRKFAAKYCIDEDNKYSLSGNFETDTNQIIDIGIDRCVPSST